MVKKSFNDQVLYKISPSGCVEKFFTHGCVRNMLYSGLDKDGRAKLGLDEPAGSGSHIAAEAGKKWENEVAKALNERKILVHDQYGTYDTVNTIKKLKEMVDMVISDHTTRYLYGSVFSVDEDFYTAYPEIKRCWYDGTDPLIMIYFSETKPDLIRASWDEEQDRVILSVIDIKLAQRMKAEHKAQVTLYVMILSNILKKHPEINAVLDESQGYLYNYDQEAERPFDIREIRNLMEGFFSDTIPRMLIRLEEALASGSFEPLWDSLEVCVGNGCEWCENYPQCSKRLKERGEINLLPYLSSYAQEYARRLDIPKGIGEFLDKLEKDDNMKAALQGNISWDAMIRNNTLLEVHKRAVPYNDLSEAGYEWNGKRSHVLSGYVDVSLFLTAQKDVGTDRVYALGYRAFGKGLEGDEKNAHIFISKKIDEEEYVRNSVEFVKSLCGFLEAFQDKRNERNEALSLQGFVMDSYEKKNLEDTVFDILMRDSISEDERMALVQLIFWMQGERTVTESDSQPDRADPSPILCISSVLKSLISLPVPIAYDLRSVWKALYDESIGSYKGLKADLFDKDMRFFGQISDAIPADLIYEVWEKGKKEVIDHITWHVEKRFRAEAAILFHIQNEGRERKLLSGYMKGFSLPGFINYNDPLIRKWAFEMHYEELLQYVRIRQARLQELDSAVEKGDILCLRMLDGEKGYRLVQKGNYSNIYVGFVVENADKYNQKEAWFSALLCHDDVDALERFYRFCDWEKKDLFPRYDYGENMGVLNFLEIERKNGNIYLYGQLKGGRFNPRYGEVYYLSERYSDINTKKINSALSELDNPASTRKALLVPDSMTGKVDDVVNVTKTMLKRAAMDGHSFTCSQERAFVHFCEKTLTVLQGPPGTGKTDFIARAIVSLCGHYRDFKEKSLKVLISANSHSAIDNALYAIADKLAEDDEISLVKINKFDNPEAAAEHGFDLDNNVLSEDQLDSYFVGIDCGRYEDDQALIVGATNWSCYKLDNAFFDIIVIDEASQVRVMDAMLCMCKGKPGKTRYLLVGDDDQLPPIIQGNYIKKPDEPYPYGSIFRFYKDFGDMNSLNYSFMLEECFRMNEVLLRYSAEKIYGSAYHSYTDNKIGDAISRRHLEYQKTEESRLWKWESNEGNGDASEIEDGIKQVIRFVLDDLEYDEATYWPLIFGKITGGDPDEQKYFERYVVTALTAVLRKTLVDETGLNSDDADNVFWLGGTENEENTDGRFGIISPHHEHIEKLKDMISEHTGMERGKLFIGTVDKLQGQQRDAIIVSYGVSDLESAVLEGEFIYSRNRLNVSLTRAKAKTIVLFSDVLTKRPFELLQSEDEDVQKGMDYVCGFLPFMSRTESDTEISQKSFVIPKALIPNGRHDLTFEVYRKRCRK